MPQNKPIAKSKQSSDMPVENVWVKAGRKERIKRVGTGIPSFLRWNKVRKRACKGLIQQGLSKSVWGSYEP